MAHFVGSAGHGETCTTIPGIAGATAGPCCIPIPGLSAATSGVRGGQQLHQQPAGQDEDLCGHLRQPPQVSIQCVC